jgi:diacylglycerol kinase
MNPFTRIIKAFGYSFSGLWYAIRNETAFLQEIILSQATIIWVGFLVYK